MKNIQGSEMILIEFESELNDSIFISIFKI